MSRQSRDEIRDGAVWNGYDYALQIWVLEGIIQPCGHQDAPECGCRAAIYFGMPVNAISGHDRGEHLYINPGKGLPLVCKICGHRWSLRGGLSDDL